MAEPLSYTRATIDSLKKSLARIAYLANIGLTGFSLLFYIYNVISHALTGHWILFGLYIGISLVTATMLFFYINEKKMKRDGHKLAFRYTKFGLNWGLIGLRAVALGFSAYDAFVIGVSDFNKMISLLLAILLLLEVILEGVKAFALHYLELFQLALDADKATLADDLMEVGKQAVKKKAEEAFRSAFFKKEKEPEPEPVQLSHHEQKVKDRLEKVREAFMEKQRKKRAESQERIANLKAKAKQEKEKIKKEEKKTSAPLEVEVIKHEE